MVKLEGLTEEEVEEKVKKRKMGKLIRITRNFFDSKKTPYKIITHEHHLPSWSEFGLSSAYHYPERDGFSFYVNLFGGLIYVNSVENKILLFHKWKLNETLNLARAYEETGFREFTVKKQYEQYER